jgi:hypothetical protein
MVFRLKYLLILSSICFTSFHASAQEVESDTILDQVLLRKKMAGGIVLHSRGWGIQFAKGRNITYFKSVMWEVNAVSMKSPKQFKMYYPFDSNSKGYFYGKLNQVYVIRGGIGIDKMLNRKPYWGGVELRLLAFGGLSMAITKPIYLNIVYYNASFFNREIVIEKYDPTRHFPDNIYGRASFSRGLGELKFYPGVYGKVGMNFEYGQFNSKVKSAEIGVVFEFFPIPVPIMAFNESDY